MADRERGERGLASVGEHFLSEKGSCPVARRFRQRLILEELTSRRPSDDYEQYLETFRRATVDANPHQIEAVCYQCGMESYQGLGRYLRLSNKWRVPKSRGI